MRTGITAFVALVAGFVFGTMNTGSAEPAVQPFAAAAPMVEVACPVWHVLEDAPDFYWLEGTSGADYYTVTVQVDGRLVESEPVARGEWVSVPASNGLTVTYWDDDRGEPAKLKTEGFSAPAC